MKKVLTTFSLLVIALFILSLYGWMVSHITKGDKQFGFITEPVKQLYSFPDLFTRSVKEVKSLPQTFVKTPENFEPVNNLESDLKVLSTNSDTGGTRSIVLLNLRNDSVHYRWKVDNPYNVSDRILNPLLFPNKELVFSIQGKPLQRIDSSSNVLWTQDSIWAHHSMNRDHNGDIWVCSFATVYHATGHYKLGGRSVFYKDNYISKVDAETGKILYHKSVSAILKENDRANYLLKSSGSITDPIHLNDVQPALKTTEHYRRGDLFLSLRQPSIVIHFRPESGEIINMIEGPFVSQHDVDLTSDSTLVIFNNNYYTRWSTKSNKPPKDSSDLVMAGDFYSNLVRYDFSDDSYTFMADSIFRANRIFTGTEGLQEFVNDSTFFVEEQNTGVIWVLREDEVVYKNVLPSQHKGYHHLANWIRIVENE